MKSYLSAIAIMSALSLGAGISPLYAQDSSVNPSASNTEWYSEAGYGQKQAPSESQLREILASVSGEINISFLDKAAQHFLAETIFWRQKSQMSGTEDRAGLVNFVAKLENVQLQLLQLKGLGKENTPDNFKIGMMLADFHLPINHSNFEKAQAVIKDMPFISKEIKNSGLDGTAQPFLEGMIIWRRLSGLPVTVEGIASFAAKIQGVQAQLKGLGQKNNMDNLKMGMMLEDFHLPITLANLKRVQATIKVMASIGKEIKNSGLDKSAQGFLAETIFWRNSSGVLTAKDMEGLTQFVTKLQNVQTQLKKENLENTPDNFKIGMMLKDFNVTINKYSFEKATTVLKEISSDQANKNDAMIAVFLAFKKKYNTFKINEVLNSLHAAALSEGQTRYLMHKIMDPDLKQTNLSLEDLIKQAKAQKFSSNDHSSTQTSGNPSVQTSGNPSVQTSGKSPVQTSGKSPVQTSGKSPVQTSGKPPVQTSGKTSVQTSGKTSVQASVKTTVQATSESTDQKKKEHSRR